MSRVLGTKGQVVIEKPIRETLGIEPGYIAVQRVVDDRVEIRFFPPEHNRSLRGILSPLVRRKLPPERWQEVRAEAWGEASGEGPSRARE
jgi:AbrB family looped-hinge helix DNA binding protein